MSIEFMSFIVQFSYARKKKEGRTKRSDKEDMERGISA
jgi:hypothetical protein